MLRFASERQLVRVGRRAIRESVRDMGLSVRCLYEVRAPGGIPDLVMLALGACSLCYVVTVEFKLNDWQRALEQAFRTRNFGNEAYVVLDECARHRGLNNIGVFARANVGLATVGRGGGIRVWHSPVPATPFSDEMAAEMARVFLPGARWRRATLPFIRSTAAGDAWPWRRRFGCSVADRGDACNVRPAGFAGRLDLREPER